MVNGLDLFALFRGYFLKYFIYKVVRLEPRNYTKQHEKSI